MRSMDELREEIADAYRLAEVHLMQIPVLLRVWIRLRLDNENFS